MQNLSNEEKSFSETIKKIKCLSEIKPQPDWVVLFRKNLELRTEFDGRQEFLADALPGSSRAAKFWAKLWQPKYHFKPAYSVFVFLAVCVCGSGLTVWASTKSLPGSFLYPIKLAIESTRLSVSSGESKGRLQSEIMNVRLEELRTVVFSPEEEKNKAEKVETVVNSLQQQLLTDKKQLPAGKNSEKSIASVKEVASRAEQVKKVIAEVKESLPAKLDSDLNQKLNDVSQAAEGTSLQILAMLVAKPEKSEAELSEISKKFNELIGEKTAALNEVEKIADQGTLAVNSTSTSVRRHINAVLINQTDEARALIAKTNSSLAQKDYAAALETLKALNEILKGAQAIAQNGEEQSCGDSVSAEAQSTSTRPTSK